MEDNDSKNKSFLATLGEAFAMAIGVVIGLVVTGLFIALYWG